MENTELQEQQSDSAPEENELQSQSVDTEQSTGSAPEETPESNAQKAINKKHWQWKEEERKRIDAERKAQELEQRLQQREANLTPNPEPVVPPMPDPYDEDIDRKLRERDEALMKKAAWQHQQRQSQARAQELKAQEEQRQLAAQQEQQKQMQEKADSFNKRATDQGFKQEELQLAANQLAMYGNLSPQLAEYFLTDEHGPAFVAHLAANPMELDNLAGMNIVQASIHLQNNVLPEAKKLVPKPSSAPDPVDTLGGAGVPEKDAVYSRGAKYE